MNEQTERETTAQQVIERHRGEQQSLMNLLAQAREKLQAAQQAPSVPDAQPLTIEQIALGAESHHFINSWAVEGFRYGVRFAERAHNIKDKK